MLFKKRNEKANAKAIHIAKSLKIQPHEPKLVKEYAFLPTLHKPKEKPVGNTAYSQ